MGTTVARRDQLTPLHAFYGATVSEFLAEAPETVVGALTTRAALEFRGNEREQARAWLDQVDLLRNALAEVRNAANWSLLLECSLRRLGRRPDAIILGPGVILVVEFKMGADKHSPQHSQQAEDYALCIRDFHGAARHFSIIPIVCAQNASSVATTATSLTDCVGAVILTNGDDLARALRSGAAIAQHERALTWQEFDKAGYNPTPTIIEAARAVYAGHSVAEIGRTDAEGIALNRAAERLRHWVVQARDKEEHVVCLVTGTPGAGKSLLGLNLVLADETGRVAGESAVMLTGNRPLVQVLRGALIADAKARGIARDASRALHGALQTLLGYLKEHVENTIPPPERVVVFDEAQRAWDEETGQKLLGRKRSEPELFLEILRRQRWACMVCLVGPGQEINRGEGGLALWGSALDREAKAGRAWRVVAASSSDIGNSVKVELDPALHLAGGLRAYRNTHYSDWVDALVNAQIAQAAMLARSMLNPPAFVTRDVNELREWLRLRRRGGRRTGLVVSSGAVRLIADGIPTPPVSKRLKEIENWFLKSWPDFRGSDSLEIPLSEFGCQGLELDYVGLCWGGDLVWSRDSLQWVPRRMSAPSWRTIRRREKAQHRLNAYRVLLTRAREGLCICVPSGVADDPTRATPEFDEIATTLTAAGCIPLRIAHAP
jgi:hypothetical protein